MVHWREPVLLFILPKKTARNERFLVISCGFLLWTYVTVPLKFTKFMVQNRIDSLKIFSLTLLFIKRIRHAWFIIFLYVFLTPKKMILIIPSTRCIPPRVHNIPWCIG